MRRSGRRSLPVGLLVGAVLAGCGGSDAASAPLDLVTYQADSSPTEIVVMRSDGSDKVQVGSDIAGLDRTNPDWSPDGTTLVFPVSSDGTDSLWTAKADGGEATLLAECKDPCAFFDDPAYSPDGTKVAAARSEVVDGEAVGSLVTVDVATGAIEVVATAEERYFFAGVRWSPDGASMVFEYVHATGPGVDADVDGVELSIIDVGKGMASRRVLTDASLFAATADWGPNSDLIVFSALPAADALSPDLFTIRPDGTGLTRLTTLSDTGGSAVEPAWSGDGKSVWFKASVPGKGTGLAIVSASGGDVRPAIGDRYAPGRHPRLHKGWPHAGCPSRRTYVREGVGTSRRRTLRQVTQPSSLMYSLMSTRTVV